MMIIERIKLDNFRQYFGHQEIELSTSKTHNVTLIHGVNGAGKTSLFLGLNWCLYGLYEDDENNGQGIEIPGQVPSKTLLSKLKDGEKDIVSVEIDFTHKGTRYNVRREITCYKEEGELLSDYSTEKFTLYKFLKRGDAEKESNPINTINTILPQTAGKYFLFDGERIDEFARPGKEEEIREAIWQVIGLEALKRSEDHLKKAAKRFTAKVRAFAEDELSELLTEEEKINNTLEGYREDVKNYNLEISNAYKEKSEIDTKLKRYERVKDTIQERQNLENEEIGMQTEWSELNNSLVNYLSRGSIILGYKSIIKSLKILEDKREKGEIPSNIKKQFIQDLIDRKLCICGTDIKKNSKEYNILMELKEKSIEDELEREAINTNIEINALKNSHQTITKEIKEILLNRQENVSRMEKIEKRLDEIRENVINIGQEEIQKLEEKRKITEQNIINLSVKRKRIQDDIVEKEKDLKDKQKKIEKTKSNNDKQENMKKKKVLTEKSNELVKKLFNTYASEKRSEVENISKKLFKDMVWKNSQFTDIKLTKEYKLEVYDRYGKPARWDLSAGERELLSLSFIAAMAKASGGEAPFVIDTPFGRISEEPRENISKFLPDMTQQLILFVTDVELTEKSEKQFKLKTGKEYTLEFDDDLGTTKILEGKHV